VEFALSVALFRGSEAKSQPARPSRLMSGTSTSMGGSPCWGCGLGASNRTNFTYWLLVSDGRWGSNYLVYLELTPTPPTTTPTPNPQPQPQPLLPCGYDTQLWLGLKLANRGGGLAQARAQAPGASVAAASSSSSPRSRAPRSSETRRARHMAQRAGRMARVVWRVWYGCMDVCFFGWGGVWCGVGWGGGQ
jgi:hypothetical protein